MNLRKNRDALDTAQLLITIATAVMAAMLQYQHSQLTQRVTREGITHTYADKILGQLSALNMPQEQRGTVVIDVLDIITEANLSTADTPYHDSQRQQMIPLRLALATRDADLLAHIGTSPRRRELWTDMAKRSGNEEIKRTAIRALGLIGRYRASVAELGTFKFCIEKILDISDDFARVQVSQEAIENFHVMVQLAGKVPILLEDKPLGSLIQRGRAGLVAAAGNAIQEGSEQPLETEPLEPDSPAQPPPAAFNQPSARAAELHAAMAPVSTPILRASNERVFSRVGNPQPFKIAGMPRQSRNVLDAAQKALKDVDSLNLDQRRASQPTAQSPSAALPPARINELKSDDLQTRQDARLELAKGGASAVPTLLATLHSQPNDPRIKVGVAFSLYKISQPVPITSSRDATALVALTGDSDPVVRQYASEFLMRVADAASVHTLQPQLTSTIERELAAPQPNQNGVYNAVVILATWVRTLPADLATEKAAITTYLRDLQPRLPATEWAKTVALIGELPRTSDRSSSGR